MRYSILSDAYEELEGTTKKLAKNEIIAKLLKKTPPEDLERVVLLLTGRVFPPWDDREIGVAENLLMKAIAKATGASNKEVVEKSKKSGDLGSTVESFIEKKKQRTLGGEELTVKRVFDNLHKIAEQQGSGSQDRKLNLLAELFSDATAQAFEINPEDVENAWNSLPDYGEIARIAKEKGTKGLQKIELQLGVPCNVLLAEKVPDLKTALDSFEKPLLQYKYDGMRVLVHKKGDKIWVFTRRLEDVTKAFPEIVEFAKKALKAKEIIVDGEALGLDSKSGKPIPFQMLSTRIKRKYDIEKAMKEIPVQVNLFDILYLNGKTLFDKR